MLSKIKSSWSNVAGSRRRPDARDSERDVPQRSTVLPLALTLDTQKSLRNESGAQPKLNKRNLPHQSPGLSGRGDVRLSLAELPGDIIISILCHSLTPWDLIAISHVSNSLKIASESAV